MNFERQKVKICEIADINKLNYSTKDKWNFINYLDTGNITENKIDLIQFIDLAQDKLPSRAKRKVKDNSIIYSTVRPNQKHFGFIKKQPLNFLVSTGFTVLDCKTNVANPKYVYYYLIQNNIVDYLHSIAEQSVSTYPSIKSSDIGDLEILLPSLEAQEKTAKILSALDDKIELNNRINKNLEEQAQALFKSWFVDFEPFGGVMPSDWKRENIYSIADIVYGAPFASKLFNTNKEGIPIIRIRDLKTQNFETYTTERHPKGYLLQKGDLVVGMDGEFRPYIWANEKAWLNQRVCVFKNKRMKGKAFLYFTIKPLLNEIEKTQVATTVIHIGKKEFDKFEFYAPNAELMDKFDDLTSPIIWEIVSNVCENQKLAQLRDTLLPKLMNGEIDVDKVEI